jgi:hypothetical protein
MDRQFQTSAFAHCFFAILVLGAKWSTNLTAFTADIG